MRNAIKFVLGAGLAVTVGCSKLSYAPKDAPIEFMGVKSITETKEGAFIVSWDRPLDTSAPVSTYRIYVKEIPQGSATSLKLQESSEGVISGSLVVDIPLQSAEDLGTVYGEVVDDTVYTVSGLSSGNYSVRVRAVGTSGSEDENIKSGLISVGAVDRFAGISTAEFKSGKIVLGWEPFISRLKGEAIRYVVYESAADDPMVFADRQKVQIIQPDKDGATPNSYSFKPEKKLPGTTWFYGVHVIDPTGKEDGNLVVKSVALPPETVAYEGCVKAEVFGATEVKVQFEYPENAEKIEILRDGIPVYTSTSSSLTVFSDHEVQEGREYEYTCVMYQLGKAREGLKKQKVQTRSSNPPTFAGITDATFKEGVVSVNWGVATGVPTKYFIVSYNPGITVAWNDKPKDDEKISAANSSQNVSKFGDELTYSFGVRAFSASDISDRNTVQIQVKIPDAGPPKTVGVTALEVKDGKLLVTAPWEAANGAVAKRRIFVKLGTAGADNIANYAAKKTIIVDDLLNVPATGDKLFLEDLAESTVYNVFVEDEDPSGNKTTTFNHMAVNSGDLKAPTFAGISGLSLGADGQKETSLTATFTAIPKQADDPSGASHYMVFVKAGGGNACQLTGQPHMEVSTAAYDAGLSYPLAITGLQPRTVYSVCIKARDLAGNVSKTDSFLAKSTIDTTPPIFDGIQGMTYNLETGLMILVWNPSPSSDIVEYRVKLWKTDKIPDPSTVSTLVRPHATSSTGFNFNNIDYTFGSNDHVYALVNACDNGNVIPGGTQNCTDFVVTSALDVTLADVDPPPGFAGIGSDTDLTSTTEGTVNVAWLPPSDWTDYRAFKIYLVDPMTNALTLKSVYTCANNDCNAERPTSAEVTNLDPYRTYKFHVRAADAAGNVTILDPITKSASIRALDSSAPNFASNLRAEYTKETASNALSWTAATDNQYKDEPGAVVMYYVYRKTGTMFADGLNPEADGDLLKVTDGTVHEDPGTNLDSGITYFYSVCAKDATGNTNCDGVVKSVTTPDMVPPTIASFTSSKGPLDKTWTLTWSATDNTTSPANLKFKVRRLYTPLENGTPGPIDDTAPTIFFQQGATTAINLTGPKNLDVFVTYQLAVEDDAGNVARSILTVVSKNFIRVDRVKASEGPTTGGAIVLVEGVGLHTSTEIKLGGSTCTGGQYISETLFLCRSPSHAVGSVDVIATNSDGSSDDLADAYSYCTAGSCTNICGNPGSWGLRFAGGVGSAVSPYLICNDVHLKNITQYSGDGKYIELKDNIDLAAYASNNFPPIRTNANLHTYAHVNGNGYVVANWKYEAPPLSSGTGLFGRLINGYDMKNIGVVNVDVKGYDNVGGLVGYADGSASHIENVFTTGKVVGTHWNTGGIVGYAQASIVGAYSSAAVTGAGRVGGIVGHKYYAMANVYATGNVTVAAANSFADSGSGVYFTDECSVGGVVGRWDSTNAQTLIGAYSTGNVSCLKYRAPSNVPDYYNYYTGGLIGYTSGNAVLKQCWASGKIIGRHQTGGLVGGGNVGFEESYFNGEVQSDGHNNVGGLIGNVGGAVTILNSYTKGKVTANGSYVGGLVGQGQSGFKIENSYSEMNIVSTYDHIGGVIGQADNSVTIKTSYATGSVRGRNYVGGFIGRQHVTTIDQSYATGAVTGTGSYTGGFVGYMQGGDMSITKSRANGAVNGVDATGGFCGECQTGNLGIVKENFSTGPVTGNSIVGGFAGRMYAGTGLWEYEKNYSTSSVLALGDNVGGFVGELRSDSGSPMEVRQCYSTGKVEGRNQVGGFAGYLYYQYFKIESNYSTSDVIGSQNIGGFVGYNNWGYFTDIHDNYSTGNVKGEANIGGFAGYTSNTLRRNYSTGRPSQKVLGVGTIGGFTAAVRIDVTHGFTTVNNYFDRDSSGTNSTVNGTGKSTAEMRAQDTYSNFDFTNFWKIPSGGGYPKLIWQP